MQHRHNMFCTSCAIFVEEHGKGLLYCTDLICSISTICIMRSNDPEEGESAQLADSRLMQNNTLGSKFKILDAKQDSRLRSLELENRSYDPEDAR